MSRDRRIGEILLSRGYIDESALTTALARQKEGEKRLIGIILVDLGLVDHEQITESLAQQWGIPYVDPTRARVDPNLLEKLPRSVVERKKILPLERLSTGLVRAAMVNPRDINAIQDIEYLLRASLTPVVSSERKLYAAIDRHYNIEKQAHKMLEGLDEDMRAPLISPISLELDQVSIIGHLKGSGASGYIDLLNFLLVNAIERRASDIHFESQSENIRVRFRIDGMLREVLSLPKWSGPPLFSRIKVVGNLDLDGVRPQDGKTSARLGPRSVDLRIATIPSQFGEKVVIRILDPSLLEIDLGELGWQPESLRSYYRLVSQPQGMVLCVGPTGSGKSTTMYSTIHRLRTETTSIITVEDPIEYSVKGISQIQVNPKAGLTFDKAVRSLLRQDPNVIVIGEIRDANTAEVAFEAAATGHLVLSSVHTTQAVSTITRIRELGVPPYLLGSMLNGIVAQRLVRRVCPECSILAEPEEEDWVRLGVEPRALTGNVRRVGPGCPNCRYVGYAGRIGVFEVMAISETIRQLLIDGASQLELWRQARKEGLISLFEDALAKVGQGITTLEEVARVVPPDPWQDAPSDNGQAAEPVVQDIITGGGEGETMGGQEAGEPGSQRTPGHVSQPVAGTRTEGPAIEVPQTPPTILIADDADEILKLVTLTLEDEYHVVQARDGVEVMEKTAQRAPDLYVLDVMMPRMSGFEVCEALKERPETAQIPVLFLSARGEAPHIKKGFHVGADDYLAKPFDPEELQLRVRALLRRSRRAYARPPGGSAPAR